MQQIGPELLGWLMVIAGLAAFALLLRLREVRQVARARGEKAEAERHDAASLAGAARQWRLITEAALKELARARELAPMQARAVSQIDAAEHAFNRLAKVGCHVAVPTVEPVGQLALQPAAEPQREPLAA